MQNSFLVLNNILWNFILILIKQNKTTTKKINKLKKKTGMCCFNAGNFLFDDSSACCMSQGRLLSEIEMKDKKKRFG